MLKSLVLSGLLASGVGAFASAPFDNQPLYSPSTQAVIYDDVSEYITLSATETAYHFDNFYTYVDSSINFSDFTIEYNSAEYVYQSTENEYISYVSSQNSIGFMIDYVNYNIDYFPQYNYFFFNSGSDELLNDSLILKFADGYEGAKLRIELDIQANQPQPSAGFISALVSFVTLLTSGIVALATGIASGVVGMAKALFLNSTATGLTIFGGLIAMFAGVALAVTLTTKVYQWITSLGN